MKAKSDDVRNNSSSGGVFTLLSQQVIAKGGIVYGAAVRKADLMIFHRHAENNDELAFLRGSKYAQSDIGDTYRQVKSQLTNGRQVLFSGTPCQIAGLRAYLGKVYDNLLCVDVICHAAPSPLVWQKYLELMAARVAGHASAPTEVFDYSRISFRNKHFGWRKFSLALGYAHDKMNLGRVDEDIFLQGFLHELFNRPSCHNCTAKSLSSGSDITLGDYWGIRERFPDVDDDRGVSLVISCSTKGDAALEAIRSELADIRECTYEDAQKSTGAIVSCPPANKKRKEFFRRLISGEDFDIVVGDLLRAPLYKRLYWSVGVFGKRMLRKMGVIK